MQSITTDDARFVVEKLDAAVEANEISWKTQERVGNDAEDVHGRRDIEAR